MKKKWWQLDLAFKLFDITFGPLDSSSHFYFCNLNGRKSNGAARHDKSFTLTLISLWTMVKACEGFGPFFEFHILEFRNAWGIERGLLGFDMEDKKLLKIDLFWIHIYFDKSFYEKKAEDATPCDCGCCDMEEE